jgi:polyisoprenoid-binding protein YceI
MSGRTKLLIAAAVVVVVGGGIAWWYLGDDEPAAVSLDSAANSVSTTTAADGGAGPTTADADLSGTWTVDSTSGQFDFESATGSFAGFRINETISIAPDTEAVGRTGDVSGSITIDGDTVGAADITVELTTITTNQSRRDAKVQEALETSEFPTATFRLTEPIDLPVDAASGADVDVTAVGELTIHGVTRSVEFPLRARLVGSTIVVVGSLDLTFSDFGVQVPTAPIILSVDDHGPMEIQLLLDKG